MQFIFLIATILLSVLHIGFQQWFIPRHTRPQDKWMIMGVDLLLLLMILWTFDQWLKGYLGEDPGYWSILMVVGVVVVNGVLKSVLPKKNEPSQTGDDS